MTNKGLYAVEDLLDAAPNGEGFYPAKEGLTVYNKAGEEVGVRSIYYAGTGEAYRVEFHVGDPISVSGSHPLLTADGWVEAQDLTEGTALSLVTENVKWGEGGLPLTYPASLVEDFNLEEDYENIRLPEFMDSRLAWLTGTVTRLGSTCSVSLSLIDPLAENILKRVFGDAPDVLIRRTLSYVMGSGLRVPEAILNGSAKEAGAYLLGISQADVMHDGEFYWSTDDEDEFQLARDIAYLARKVGGNDAYLQDLPSGGKSVGLVMDGDDRHITDDEVVSVEELGEQELYDLELEAGDATYLLHGVVSRSSCSPGVDNDD